MNHLRLSVLVTLLFAGEFLFYGQNVEGLGLGSTWTLAVQSASPTGPSGDSPTPVVHSISAVPGVATYGQRVILTADAPSGLSYSWVQLGTTGANIVVLSGANTRTASFTAPSFTTTLRFRFTVSDDQNRSDSRDISVQVRPSGSTNPPYDPGTPSGTATGETVSCAAGNHPAVAEVPARFTITGGNVAAISATNGRDPDNTVGVPVGGAVGSAGVSYQWSLLDGAGVLTSAALSGTATPTVRVNTPPLARTRTALLAMLIRDPLGCGTRYRVELVMTPATNPDNPPVVEVEVRIDLGDGFERPLGPEDSVAPGDRITLDGSLSRLEDGTLPENLTFFWHPLGCHGLGTCVPLADPTSAVIRIRAPRDATDWRGGDRLEYELVVSHDGVQSDPLVVTIPFQQRRYLAQVAAGSLGPSAYLQTMVVLTNPTPVHAEVFIDFFDNLGQPFRFELDGAPAEGPYLVAPFSSRELPFRSPPGEILQGWGVVSSDRPVSVIAQYQVVNLVTNRPTRQVSLFDSDLDSRFAVHFNTTDDMALALANPGSEPVTVRYTLTSVGSGGSGLQLLVSQQLDPGQHVARFVREIFQEVLDAAGLTLENLPSLRLRIEAERGRVILTSLITQDLLPFATNPPIRLQRP